MSKKQSKKTRPDLSKEDNEFFIPADDEDWNQQAARLKLQFTGMADLPQDCLASGSETTDGQFMTYRGHKVPLDNATVFESRRKKYGISDDIWEKADRIARNFDELDAFIGLLNKGTLSEHIKEKDRSWPGSFFR